MARACSLVDGFVFRRSGPLTGGYTHPNADDDTTNPETTTQNHHRHMAMGSEDGLVSIWDFEVSRRVLIGRWIGRVDGSRVDRLIDRLPHLETPLPPLQIPQPTPRNPNTNQSLTCLRTMDRLNHDATALGFSHDGRLLAGAFFLLFFFP